MEFLATIKAVGTLIAELNGLLGIIKGLFKSSERDAKLKELQVGYNQLTRQIKGEGEKIERYVAFSKIVNDIDRGLASVLDIHRNAQATPGVTDPFWGFIETLHKGLREDALQLRSFDPTHLDVRDRTLIGAHSQGVTDKVIQADAIVQTNGSRESYVQLLNGVAGALGYLKPVGSNILGDIGGKLRDFGG